MTAELAQQLKLLGELVPITNIRLSFHTFCQRPHADKLHRNNIGTFIRNELINYSFYIKNLCNQYHIIYKLTHLPHFKQGDVLSIALCKLSTSCISPSCYRINSRAVLLTS